MKKANILSLLSLTMLSVVGLASCGGQSSSTPEPSIPAPIQVTTDLDETKEIHTERQKEYFAYDGDYSTMAEEDYPDGKQHLSEPLAVTLEWDYTLLEDKELDHYSVVFGQNEDLSDGYEVKGTLENSIDIYNSYLGYNYFQVFAKYKDGTEETSDVLNYYVEETGVRNLKIDGMTNCRDMGGKTLIDGGKIKQGMIFRTSGTRSWGNGRAVVPDSVTEEGKEVYLHQLGIKTQIDINNSGSNYVEVEQFYSFPMNYNGGKHHFFRNTEPLKKVFELLAEEENYPISYNCRIGTDRTGLTAILINGLLGLDKNLIYQDYLFSNFGNIQEKRYIGSKAGADDILNYINDIETMPGDSFQNKVYNVLLAIGVERWQLDNIISILTEGTPVQGNREDQVIGLVKDFTAEGVTKSTYTRNDMVEAPEYYVIDQASKSISYSFDVEEGHDVKVIIYMGCTDSASNKYLDNALKITLDGDEVPLDHISYSAAGFGQSTPSVTRTAYSAVVVGGTYLSDGSHTVTLQGGTAPSAIRIVSICLFNAN